MERNQFRECTYVWRPYCQRHFQPLPKNRVPGHRWVSVDQQCSFPNILCSAPNLRQLHASDPFPELERAVNPKVLGTDIANSQ